MALGFMSKTSMGNPAFRTFPAMGLPMFPTPMKPTDRAIARLLDPDGEVGRLRGRGEHSTGRRCADGLFGEAGEAGLPPAPALSLTSCRSSPCCPRRSP